MLIRSMLCEMWDGTQVHRRKLGEVSMGLQMATQPTASCLNDVMNGTDYWH